MKTIFSIITIIISSLVYSQEFKFEEVVKVDSTTTKDELYNRARAWVVKTFNDEKAVLSIQDKETGELSGSGSMRFQSSRVFFGVVCVNGNISYKFSIFLKDGRYKYLFHSFVHSGSYFENSKPISYGMLTLSDKSPEPSRGSANDKAWNEIKLKANLRVDELVSSLKEGMSKKYEVSNDW